MLHVALYQPQIPPNVGATARQCVGMNARLHLIGPYAFDLSEHAVKRAGLDYWPDLRLSEHATPEAFLHWLSEYGRPPWLISRHASLRYDQAAYGDGDVLVFGNEKAGLPAAWHERWPARRLLVPVLGPVRSYNLANTAAIVLAQACSTAGLYER